jgi:hypothetical protein
MAFGIMNALDESIVDDPAYVEWSVTMDRWADGVYEEIPVLFRKCTEEDRQ